MVLESKQCCLDWIHEWLTVAYLDHDVVRVNRLLNLIDPALDHIRCLLDQVNGRNECRTGHAGHLVDDRLLHVALNALQHRILFREAVRSGKCGTEILVRLTSVILQRARMAGPR